MTRIYATGYWLLLGLGLSHLWLIPALARGAAPVAAAATTNAALKCPVDTFREVLAMDATQREQYLANRPLPSRRLMELKLSEYESLTPTQRELRLSATELHWYLLPLLTAPSTNRPAQLAAIPSEVRSMVKDRLLKWDSLPADAKVRLLAKVNPPMPEPDEPSDEVNVPPLPPQVRENVERGILQWRELNEDQRQQLAERFYHFMELTTQERERRLRTLSGPERQQIERTLSLFAGLSPEQRAACFESFEKFASLSLAEREQFMQNARQWERMSPEERQQLRDYVELLQKRPPRPPLAVIRIPRPPPLPTNQN
jgi:hypothetical protein